MGTFGSLMLYLGMIAIGIFIGSRKMIRSKSMTWLSKFQTVALVLMIFLLGVEIGSDERVIQSLGTIGVSALTITVLAMAGSVAAVCIVRKLMGLDKMGRKKSEDNAGKEGSH